MTSPPTASELARWTTALQTRIERDSGAPFAYLTKGTEDRGYLHQASYLSELLPRVPEGFSRDSLVLRLVTSSMDAPLAWPRKLLRLSGHRLEGRTADMSPLEMPVWTLDLLPAEEKVPTGFIVDLIGIREGKILVLPGTPFLPSAVVPPVYPPGAVERGAMPPEMRNTAFCLTAWSLVEAHGLTGVKEVQPVALGVRILPGLPHAKREVQVVVRLTLDETASPLLPVEEVRAQSSASLQDAIDKVLEIEATLLASPPSAPPAQDPS